MTAPFPSDGAEADPKGHGLLLRRVAMARELALGMLVEPLGEPWEPSVAGVVATGVGSSEAHARHLVGLLNAHTSVPAEFVSLGSFADPGAMTEARRARTLVVFSQGLAPNARVALSRAGEFAGCVVVTAATEAGQFRAGRPERAELLGELIRGGARVERFPVEDEYTLLVRVIGPACGFVAALRLAGSVSGSWIGRVEERALLAGELGELADGPWPGRIRDRLGKELESGWEGGVMVMPGELVGCAQNLAAKFVEGLYVAPPRMVETLELVHGTFQQLKARPAPVWVLGEDPLSIRARDLLESAGMKPFHVPVPELAGAMPLALELLFNPALVDGVQRLGLDQVNWPGKGLDGPLYGFEGGV